MLLNIRGYRPLTIPDHLLVPMNGHFGGETPYVAKIAARWSSPGYLSSKLPLKLLCLEALRARANSLGGYQSYSDPMAGVGISARLFGTCPQVLLGDRDPSCREVLKANFKGRIRGDDIFKTSLPEADLVFLDFNDFTWAKYLRLYRPVLDGAFAATRKFVVLNDCSPFYLRYGQKALEVYSKLLGTPLTGLDDYFRAVAAVYKRQGWFLVHVARFYESSFQLLARQRAPLQLELTQSAPPGMVTATVTGRTGLLGA